MGHYPYGESWYNASNDKLIFTSYERDSESGNDYAQARYYVNRLGRFSSVDPLSGNAENPQSLNRYAYVRNAPVMLTDPSGLCTPGFIETKRRRMSEFKWAGAGMELLPSELESEMSFQEIDDGSCIGSGGGGGSTGGDPPLDPGPLPPPPGPDCNSSTVACVSEGPDNPYYNDPSNGAGLGGGGLILLGPGGGGLTTAINQARLMLSNPDCANFLKSVLTNLGHAPNLDAFLNEFDHLTILPTPAGDAKSDPGFPGFPTTAHIADGVGQSSTIHVDAPRAADLVPTLLHETFHDTLYSESDPSLAAAAGNPVPKATPAGAQGKVGSRNASAAFDQHCTPK